MNIQTIRVETEKDIIFIQLNKDLEYDEAFNIIKNIQHLFPKNNILAVREDSIKDLIILKSSEYNSINPFNKDNTDLVDWLETKIKEIK